MNKTVKYLLMEKVTSEPDMTTLVTGSLHELIHSVLLHLRKECTVDPLDLVVRWVIDRSETTGDLGDYIPWQKATLIFKGSKEKSKQKQNKTTKKKKKRKDC